MLERTLVFVDTSYLLASFYNSWEEGARGQLEIALSGVVQTLNHHAKQLVNQPVQRQLWYDGIPDSGPHRYQRTLRMIEGVQLRAGQLIEWGDRRTQKGVDTLLVADLVQAAYRGQMSDVVLVTGDADMIPGVDAAVQAGIRVHLIGFGWDSVATTLRHHCDSSMVLQPRVDFADCMQIRVLEGPVAPTVRPGEPRPVVPGAGGIDDDAGAPAGESTGADAVAPAADRAEPTPDARPGAPAGPEPDEGEPAAGPDDHVVDGEDGVDDAGEDAETGPAAPDQDEPDRDEPAPDESAPGDAVPGGAARDGAGHVPSRPSPSMMAMRRKPLRSRYVPLSEEVWTSSGVVTPYDVGQQYATWWFEEAANEQQRDEAHLLSGGALPSYVDRPLLQFACQMLNEFTLDEYQRVSLRDGFHEGIRAVLLKHR